MSDSNFIFSKNLCLKNSLFIVSSLVLAGSISSAAIAAGDSTHDFMSSVPIVVTATRFAASIDTALVNTTIITSEDIANGSADTLADVLKTQAGLHVSDLFGISGSKASVDMGGFGQAGAHNTLILLNGRRLNDMDLQGANLSGIPLSSIAQIEVVNGSSTVLYGDNAVSGVINIVTKNGFDEKHMGAKLSIGSFDTKRLSADMQQAKGNNAYSLALDTLSSDGYRDNSAFDSNSLVGEVMHAKGNNEMGVRINASTDKLELPGALNETLFKDDPTQSTFTIEQAKEKRTTVEGFVLGENYSAELGLRDKHQEATIFGDTEADLKTLSFTPRVKGQLGAHKLVAGIDFYRSTLDSSAIFGGGFPAENASDTKRTSKAVYLTDTSSLGNNTTLQLGLRRQYVKLNLDNTNLLSSSKTSDSQTDVLTAWDITVSHRHLYGAKNYLRAASSFRFPVLDEMWNYFSGNVAILNPQTGRHIEIGTQHRLNNGVSYNLNLFKMDLKEEIGYNNATFSNVNFDDTQHKGLNLNVQIPVAKKLDGQIRYAYRKATFDDGPNQGKKVPLVPQNKLSLSAQYRFNKQQQIAANAVYTGKRYFGDDLSNSGKHMSGYTRLDLSYKHRFDKISLKAIVKNLTNVSQADSGFYNTFSANPYSYYPLPERAFYFTLEGKL